MVFLRKSAEFSEKTRVYSLGHDLTFAISRNGIPLNDGLCGRFPRPWLVFNISFKN
jgi:hypothetical protein